MPSGPRTGARGRLPARGHRGRRRHHRHATGTLLGPHGRVAGPSCAFSSGPQRPTAAHRRVPPARHPAPQPQRSGCAFRGPRRCSARSSKGPSVPRGVAPLRTGPPGLFSGEPWLCHSRARCSAGRRAGLQVQTPPWPRPPPPAAFADVPVATGCPRGPVRSHTPRVSAWPRVLTEAAQTPSPAWPASVPRVCGAALQPGPQSCVTGSAEGRQRPGRPLAAP